MEHVLFCADDNGVAGVRSPLIPGDNIDLVAEEIDNFSLTFIPPLSSHDDCYWHKNKFEVN